MKFIQNSQILSCLSTDLHTHFSSSVPSKSIIKIGVEHNFLYPVHLLDRIGVKYNEDDVIILTGKAPIYPLLVYHEKEDNLRRIPLSKLEESALSILERSMSIPSGERVTFGDLKAISDYVSFLLFYPVELN